MPVPCIPQRHDSLQTSSLANVGNRFSSNAPGITPHFVPFAANDVSRYDNRLLVAHEETPQRAEFLSNLTGTFFGVKALATVYSLPYVTLMWGMIYFAIALLYNVFKSTTTAMPASVASGKRYGQGFVVTPASPDQHVPLPTTTSESFSHYMSTAGKTAAWTGRVPGLDIMY
ncbi:uncharacterized protein EDB91DRAFT_1338455, partial [Suillus paluster]|uniref:uncharacterized protein n=1 Tax=Suillus paluster TaxID=48578 RepID=UPI001B85E018